MGHVDLECTRGSFPTRERGLKFFHALNPPYSNLSFPTRERGLKLTRTDENGFRYAVVPHAGTWIEMVLIRIKTTVFMSFPTRERGLKSAQNPCTTLYPLSFPTRERGLKSFCFQRRNNYQSRSPRGNVD